MKSLKWKNSIFILKLISIVVIIYSALPALAEQASAESADFTVNTVPEPGALVLIVLAGFLLRWVRGINVLYIAFLALWVTLPALQTYAAAPIVTNVTAQQQAWPLTDIDIYYDLYDADGDSNYVHIGISTNSGALYNVVATNFSGDVGHGIVPGEGKHIVWDAGVELQQFSSSTVRVRITIDDSVPTEMVLIPAGYFDMGDTFNEGESNELPDHTVYVSGFYLNKYEVTNEEVRRVLQWAYDNDKITATATEVINNEGISWGLLNVISEFCQISFSNTTFSVKAGKDNYPCVEITWFGAMAYCKYRNEMEGKEQTIDLTDWSIDFSKKGYRLPTEAEWEKAARGGAVGHGFPWIDTDTITHSRANYFSTNEIFGIQMPYDVSPTRYWHPDYGKGDYPYTSPIGSFAPNGYGLYDMAGNVMEWCWDYYDSSYYGSSPVHDPRGPNWSLYRVIRDGSWCDPAYYLRCAFRACLWGTGGNDLIGFRCVCPLIR